MGRVARAKAFRDIDHPVLASRENDGAADPRDNQD